MPTPVPNNAMRAPAAQDAWLVFADAKAQRRAYITIRPEGPNLRVRVQVVAD